MSHKITLPELTYSKNQSIGLWILLTTSSEDVTFTPGRTSKDATLHHSLQEQIINNYWRRERKVNMCFVSYEQIYYWSMPRAIRSSLFSILMPKTKLRHAQSTFSSLIHPLFPALWRLKCEQKVRSITFNLAL